VIFTEDDPPLSISEPNAPPTAEPSGPLFSKALPAYVEHAVTDKGWRGQSRDQNETTFSMFQEVCGDLPVNAYTRRHLSDFYNTLRALPALYSKDKRWRGRPLGEVVEAAKDDPAPRLTMKTVKRHFSALGGFFIYAKRHGLITGENPAHGFGFPKKGRANSKRKMWEGEKLRKLFQSPVWTGCHPFFRSQPGPKIIRDDRYWLPLLGLYLTQMADLESRPELVLQQERVTVEVPGGPQDAARQVQLDVVDAVLDLLADRFDEAVGSVDLERMSGREEVAGGRREEVSGSEQARPDILAGVEGALPGDIHVVVRAGTAQPREAGVGERRHHAMAEQRDLVGERHFVRKVIVRMDVDVPQSGHEEGAPKVDLAATGSLERASVGVDLADTAVLDQYRCMFKRSGIDAVHQGRVCKESAHKGHDQTITRR
jgi:hypothetical protein